MDKFHLIQRVVQECYLDLKRIDFEMIHDNLKTKNVLSQRQLSTLGALSTIEARNDHLFFVIAPQLDAQDFFQLIEVIKIAYPEAGEKVSQVFNSYEKDNTNENASSPDSYSGTMSGSFQESVQQQQPSVKMGLAELPSSSKNPLQTLYLNGSECTEDVRIWMERQRRGDPVPGGQTTIISQACQSQNESKSYSSTSSRDDKIYDMNSHPRGVVLIINNYSFLHMNRRSGSEADRDKVCKMFKTLGWHVTSKNNLTAKEMDVYLKKFASHKSLTGASALAVVILTHGMLNDIYFGTDGRLIKGQPTPVSGTYINKFELMQNFSSRSCPAMSGKPKWFIIQACRGSGEDISPQQEGLSTAASSSIVSDDPTQTSFSQGSSFSSAENSNRDIPDTGDMCFIFASSTGYKAYRWKNTGSPFISTLTDVVKRKAHQTEMCYLMREVINEFYKMKLPEGKRTLPEFSSQLPKGWYLLPAGDSAMSQ